MATLIETAIGQMRCEPVNARILAQTFVELLDAIRTHRTLVQELGEGWQLHYEYKSHVLTLTHFRNQVMQWAKEASGPQPHGPDSAEFELVAWRVLGAGALLLDVYEQSDRKVLISAPPETGLFGRLRGMWAQFMTVLHLRP